MKGAFERAEALIAELLRQAQRRQDADAASRHSAPSCSCSAPNWGTRKKSRASSRAPLHISQRWFRCAPGSRSSMRARGRDSEARLELDFLAQAGFARIPIDWNWIYSISACAEVAALVRRRTASHRALRTASQIRRPQRDDRLGRYLLRRGLPLPGPARDNARAVRVMPRSTSRTRCDSNARWARRRSSRERC